MYFNILKKDLKRKKTMNLILLLFIIPASTFIAGSVNNIIAVATALDNYFAKANVPDYWICTNEKEEADKIESFIKSEQLSFMRQDLLQIDPNQILVNGEEFDYANLVLLSDLNHTIHIFDSQNQKIDKISDGELYISAEIYNQYHLKIGDKITLTNNNKSKTYTLKGSTKDAMFGSTMIGMTRFLVSEHDYQELASEENLLQSIGIFTNNVEEFADKINQIGFRCLFTEAKSTLKMMYIMDMVIAACMLVVSICLILISLIMLRFTIHFTISEEFREIGVMKAIGIPCYKIRGLYLVKYFIIALAGGITGLMISIPFGKMLLLGTSKNIVITNEANPLINILSITAIIGIVVLFGYLCTRKIKKFTPVSAIRNGESGERYRQRNIIKLNKIRIAPVIFMSLNDIFSGFQRFAVMLVIFILGVLLIIIPVNTINTLQSDKLIVNFSAAECDHVIVKETPLNSKESRRELTEQKLLDIKERLAEHDVSADIFQEKVFSVHISKENKKCFSQAFQGVGDVSTEQYSYLLGTPPQNIHEVGISHIISDNIDANIGDTVTINTGSEEKKYTVTAIFQTMNNLGKGIRFFQEETLDYNNAAGSFGIQIKYTDSPDKKELQNRKELLEELFSDCKIYTAGEYIGYMIGDVAEQIQSVKQLILIIVICINVLVTVLMVKSFLTKEKGEIAMLKALGFRSQNLVIWQLFRIGIILFLAVLTGVLISSPISKITIGNVFQMMGLQTIEFDIVFFEVFVVYPFILFICTVFAAFLTALGIRKISAFQVSNIE